MDPNATADSGFDLDAAVSDIGSALFDSGTARDEPADETDETPELDTAPETTDETETAPETTDKPPESPQKRQPPKSWAKEKHTLWETLTPEAQDYYEQREKQFLDGLEQYKGDAGYAKQLREVITPYKALFDAAGVPEAEAVNQLLGTYARLTTGTEQARRAAYEQLGQELGFSPGTPGQPSEAGQEGAIRDPLVHDLQKKLEDVQSRLTAREQAELQAARQKAVSEVEVFAADPANVYFNEVAADMTALVKQGLSLKDAYDKAVWGNPVTRAKELARIQTDAEANRTRKQTERSETVQRATAPNVRETPTRKAPTEPKGKFLDEGSMLADLRAIKARN